MEAFAEFMQPYKDVVGSVASMITILQFFSGMFICRDIYKRGTTKDISSIPFVGGIVIGILVLKFAIMLQDHNMFNVNVAAITLNSMYLGFFMTYCEDTYTEVIVPSLKGAALTVILLFYCAFEHQDAIEFRYSMIVTILMLTLMGSPLIEIKTILDNKDASSIPLPLTFMGCIVSLLWLLYGIILRNNFMIVQNVFGTILCFWQLVLIAMYPGTGKDKKKKVESKKED